MSSFHRQDMSKEKASELLARFQLQQVEANPQWFAKYEDYCGAKGVEAVRATPGYARLYETMKRLFMAILTPGMSTLETAERMAVTHQRIGVKFEWFLAACLNVEDEMRQLEIPQDSILRFRQFLKAVARCYEEALEQAKDEALTNAERLQALVEKLQAMSNQVAQSAHELAEGQKDLSKRVEQDAASTEEISAAIEELDHTFANMQHHAQDTLKDTKDVLETIKGMQAVMTRTVDLMQTIAQEAKGMGEILQTIGDISFQTNILSLNASVEAARAGQQGLGFNVIAVEIRKLSNRVSEEAKMIAKGVNRLLKVTDQGETAIVQTAADTERVVAAVDQVDSRMQDTMTAIDETTAGFAQIREAITSIDQGLQRTVAMVEEISATSDALLSHARQLAQVNAGEAALWEDARDNHAPSLGKPKSNHPMQQAIEPKSSPGRDQWETF